MKATPPQSGHRLSVLLTEAEEAWANQLPRLLEPQGVRTIRVDGVDEAVRVIESEPIHAVMVDVAMPKQRYAPVNPTETGGLRLLKVIQRIDPSPPAVVIRGRRFDGRTDDRILSEALKLDAFSVLDQPVELEQLLAVFRRLIDKHYGGIWPTTS
ncbi:MAG: response regulator [Planctomycetota bacterium]|jgi:DNA-binding NtrC family response regulator